MTDPLNHIVCVERAMRAEWDAALRLVTAGRRGDSASSVSQIIRLADSRKIAMDGLIVARRRQNIVGAAWANFSNDQWATVWAPELVPEEPESTAFALLSKLDCILADRRIHYAQSLVAKDSCQHADWLRRNQFRHTAEIVYLASFYASFPAKQPSHSLEFERYSDGERSRLIETVEATYAQSLDLPGLNGLRATGDVLNSYATMEESSRPLWFFVRHDERDVGCLLITDHRDQTQCELVYMGIVPQARRRGWGYMTTRHAQWITKSLGRDQLVASADAANRPALRMYDSAGFYVCGRRDLFTKQIE